MTPARPIPHRLGRIAVLLSLLQAMAFPARGQWPVHGTIFVRNVETRWLNAKQSPFFTPWNNGRTVIHLDSLSPSNGGVIAFMTVGEPDYTWRGATQSVIDRAGRVLSITGDLTPLPKRSSPALVDSIEEERYRLRIDGPMTVAANNIWDMIPSFHPSRLARGERWTDSVHWSGSHAGASQSIEGIRVSRLIRDSAIDGHHYWEVLDTLRGTFRETVTENESTLRHDVVINRVASGVMTGHTLIDPTNRTIRDRYDTLEFRGKATLEYPDGRRFTSPTRLQQRRHLEGHDSVDYVTDLEARRAAAPRFSMFTFPEGIVEEKLAAGDVHTRDSLLHRLATSRDVYERIGIDRTLWQWRTPNEAAFKDTVRSIQLKAGDTARVVEQLFDPAMTRLTNERLELILPFIRDPGLAFAWGIPAGEFYENLEQRLGRLYPRSHQIRRTGHALQRPARD